MSKNRTSLATGFIKNLTENFNKQNSFLDNESFKMKIWIMKKALNPIELEDFIKTWRNKIFFSLDPITKKLVLDQRPSKRKINAYIAGELSISPHTVVGWRYNKKECSESYKRYFGLLNTLLEVLENEKIFVVRKEAVERQIEEEVERRVRDKLRESRHKEPKNNEKIERADYQRT